MFAIAAGVLIAAIVAGLFAAGVAFWGHGLQEGGDASGIGCGMMVVAVLLAGGVFWLAYAT